MANKEFTERLPMTLLLSQLPIVVEYERPEQIMEDILALARVKNFRAMRLHIWTSQLGKAYHWLHWIKG